MEDRVSEYSKDGGEYNGDHDGFLHNIFTHEESGMGFLFSDEMPDANGTTLRHGDAEQIGKHDDIDTIGACGKSFDAQHIDEEGNHYLRRTVRKLFAGRRESHLHQIFQFYPRERTEIGNGEAVDMLAEQDDEQENHRHATAESGGNGSTFHTQFGKTELPEDEGIVAYNIENVDNNGYQHRVNGFIGTAQGGGKC